MDSRHAFTEIGKKGIWRGYETLCLLSGKNREAHSGRGQLTCRTCNSDHRSLVGLTIVPIFSDKLVGQEIAEQIEKIRAIPVVLIEIHDSTECVCVCVCVCVCTHLVVSNSVTAWFVLRRSGKNTQKNYTKKNFMTQITTMV